MLGSTITGRDSSIGVASAVPAPSSDELKALPIFNFRSSAQPNGVDEDMRRGREGVLQHSDEIH